MYAVIGRVKIKPGHSDETLAMIGDHGAAMLQGMTGSNRGYWARTVDDGDLIQHSFWLFDTKEHARSAERPLTPCAKAEHRRSSSASTSARSLAKRRSRTRPSIRTFCWVGHWLDPTGPPITTVHSGACFLREHSSSSPWITEAGEATSVWIPPGGSEMTSEQEERLAPIIHEMTWRRPGSIGLKDRRVG